MVTIYGIRCNENGKTYVGCTAGKLAKRLREHRSLLRRGKHKCLALQFDWAKYGESAFWVNTLAILADGATIIQKRETELRYMRGFASSGLLYNEHIVSFSGTEDSLRKAVALAHDKPGNRWTKEANEKRRLAQLGKPKGHGAKISATKRAKNAMR